MPYRLIKPKKPTDTIHALETLLAAARRGDVLGMAYVAMLPRNRYYPNVSGMAHTYPTLARGALKTLDDELAALVHSRDAEETR